jgi:hypothetical protein
MTLPIHIAQMMKVAINYLEVWEVRGSRVGWNQPGEAIVCAGCS